MALPGIISLIWNNYIKKPGKKQPCFAYTYGFSGSRVP